VTGMLFRRFSSAVPAALIAVLCATLPNGASAQSTELARFVGTYDGTRAVAGGNAIVNLVLYTGGGAKLTTTPPAPSGKRPVSVVERGTWSFAERLAIAHFTLAVNVVDNKPADRHVEDVALSFKLSRCNLSIARDDANVYGNAGLTLRKAKC